MESRVVQVEISGMRYPIRSHLDAAYIADLAAYVEEKMELASKESPAGDTLKIAVLAALNIADEYFRARHDGAAQRNGLTERALELERMLDLALGTEESGGASNRSSLARTAGSF
jgi:cell division protein ZapA